MLVSIVLSCTVRMLELVVLIELIIFPPLAMIFSEQ